MTHWQLHFWAQSCATTAALRAAFALLLWIASIGFAPDIRAEPVLRVATWDLTHADPTTFAPKKRRAKSSWRHTFGSERDDNKFYGPGVFNLPVDAVLLQGVRSIPALRRVFPPRTWNLIVSRDYTYAAAPLSTLPRDLRAFDISAYERNSKHPVTAIAVRYQRRLRVRGIAHLTLDPAGMPSNGETSSPYPSPIAIRLNYHGHFVWLASMASSQNCHVDIGSCPSEKSVGAWQADRAEAGDDTTVLTGGSRSKPGSDKNAKKFNNCGIITQRATSDSDRWHRGKSQKKTRKKLGCIVLTTYRPPNRSSKRPTIVPTLQP